MIYVRAKSLQLCLTLCDPMDCIPPDSSVHGILQARILEWVAMPFSRGSSWSRNGTWVSCIADRFFTLWATRASDLANCKHLPQGPLSPVGACSSTQAAITCENSCHFVASTRSRATISLLSLSLPLTAASATPGFSVSCLTSITCSRLAPPSPTALRSPTGEPVLGRRHSSLPLPPPARLRVSLGSLSRLSLSLESLDSSCAPASL